jgi:hypothetical protein
MKWKVDQEDVVVTADEGLDVAEEAVDDIGLVVRVVAACALNVDTRSTMSLDNPVTRKNVPNVVNQ